MATVAPGAIWEFHEKILNGRELALRVCEHLKQDDVKLRYLEPRTDRTFDPEHDDRNVVELLSDAWSSGSESADIMYALGTASGPTGNPLPTSLHSQVLELRRSLLTKIRDPELLQLFSGPDELTHADQLCSEQAARRELAQIADSHFEQLERITPAKLVAEVEAACGLIRETETSRATQAAARSRDTNEETLGELELPIITSNLQFAVIEWKRTRTQVDLDTADAFQAMIAAKGQPVGIGTHVRKPAAWLAQLRKLNAELAAIVVRADGNKGYRLTVFDAPSGDA